RISSTAAAMRRPRICAAVPRFDLLGLKPALHGRGGDVRGNATLDDGTGELARGPARQRFTRVARQRAGERRDACANHGGEKRGPPGRGVSEYDAAVLVPEIARLCRPSLLGERRYQRSFRGPKNPERIHDPVYLAGSPPPTRLFARAD